jgi:hypothetical protein
MYYYAQTDGVCIIKHAELLTGYDIAIQDDRDIPVENAMILNDKLYDSRELDYWKTAKKIELDNYIAACFANGYETNGIKVSTTELSLNKLNQMARLNDENQDKSVGLTMYDYYNQSQPVTKEVFKKIIKDVGNYMTGCESKYRDGINALAKAKTISEVQAIIV